MPEDETDHVVPVWTLATEERASKIQTLVEMPESGLSAGRVSQLRDALSAYLDTPLVTLEQHSLPRGSTVSRGQLLDAASPLAQQLTGLITQSSQTVPATAAAASATGETLYRMILPAKVAGGLGDGFRAMRSATVENGIHSAVIGKSGIAAQASFVPVSAGAASGGALAAAGGTAGVAGAITVAAPLVVLAVAVAASVYAEEQRREAIERVVHLLEKLDRSDLDSERDRLTGCTRAIDKAASILLDEGAIGHSLGLDSAVNAIDTAIATATRRAEGWQRRIDGFKEGGATLKQLNEGFPGIGDSDGEFRVQLRLAALAISLKRRVAVLQAVEHAQKNPELVFARFTAQLRSEQSSVDELETQLAHALADISRVQLRTPTRKVDNVMLRKDVNRLLTWPATLRELAEEETPARHDADDVQIDIIRQPGGALRVLPPLAVSAS